MAFTLLLCTTLLAFAQVTSHPTVDNPPNVAAVEERNNAPTVTKTIFREADRLAAEGQHEEAAKSTEAGVVGVRDPARRSEIAALYLNAAHALLYPTDPAARPSPERAWPLLIQAEALDAFAAREAEGQGEMLRVAAALKHAPQERILRARAFLQKFPADPRRDEVLYLLGDAQREAGALLGARETWALISAPATPARGDWKTVGARKLADSLLDRARQDASWLGHAIVAVDRSKVILPDDPDVAAELFALATLMAAHPSLTADALARLSEVETRFPGTEHAGKAALLRADWLIAWGRADEAIDTLQAFLAGRAVDQLYREGAAKRINTLLSEATRLLGLAQGGVEGARVKWLDPAASRFREFLKDAPSDPRVPAALMALAEISELRGDLDAARSQWRDLMERFPKDGHASEAEYRIAKSLVDEGRFTDGLEALDKVTGGWKNPAGALSQQLRSPALQWISTGVRTSGAPAVLRLRCRNVDEVEVRMFAIDLEDVFLADGDLDQLAALDVNLIQPDRIETVRIPGYQPYAEIEHAVSIPLSGEGAMVVSARHDRIEARTVSIKSDLEIAAVATRDRVDVVGWSRSGEGAGGIVPIETTRTSVNRQVQPLGEFEPPTDGGLIAVFGAADGDLAIAKVDTRGLSEARLVEPSAVLRVERDTARPGETLAAFGLVSDPDDGRPRPPTDPSTFRLEWWDTTLGVRLKQTALRPTTSGQFYETLAIDPALAGRHEIAVRIVHEDGGDGTILAARMITVDAFAEGLRIEVESDDIYRTGDTGTVHLRLGAAHGAALSNRALTLTVGEDQKVDANTDANGRLRVSILQDHTRRPGGVPIVVDTGEGTAATTVEIRSRAVVVLPEGRAADGLPGVPGEPFEIPLRTTYLDGTPIDATVRVRVVDPDLDQGETRHEIHDITTDASGRGVFSFTPQHVGVHTVEITARGHDRLNDAVPTRVEVKAVVAGDGDRIPVHLIPAISNPAPGAALPLRIHSELDDGPALLVTHDEAIGHTEAVWLKKGMNSFELPTPAWPARIMRITCVAGRHPNVVLPTIHLDLAADLEVSVTAGPQDRTGLDLDLTALDPFGEPVTGDATLWVLDADDLDRARSDLETLTDEFAPRRTDAFVQIGTSGTFTPPAVIEEWDPAIGRALSAIEDAARVNNAAVMVDSVDLSNFITRANIPGLELQNEGIESNDVFGVSGGQGGRYGGKGGGYGKKTKALQQLAYTRAALDTVRRHPVREGQAIVHLRTDRAEPGQRLAVLALVIGADQRIGVTSLALPVARAVSASLSGPRSLRADDTSSLRATVVNSSGAPRSVVVRAETRPLGSADAWAPVGGAQTLMLAPREHTEALIELNAISESSEVRVSVGDQGLTHAIEVVDDDPLLVPAWTSPLDELIWVDDADTANWGPDDRTRRAALLWSASQQLLAASKSETAGATSKRAMHELRAVADERLRALLALHEGRTTRRGVTGRSEADDHFVEALELAALSTAKNAGLDLPEAFVDATASAVQRRLADSLDLDEQAWLLYCGSFHRTPDYARLNRLVRDRAQLGSRALMLLAATLVRAGRTQDAEVLSALLVERHPEFDGLASGSGGPAAGASYAAPFLFPPHAGPAPAALEEAGDQAFQIQRRILCKVAVRDGRPYAIGSGVLERGSVILEHPEGHALRLDQPVDIWLTVRWTKAPTGSYWIYERLPAGVALDVDSVTGARTVVPTAQGMWFRITKSEPNNTGVMVHYRIVPRTPGLYAYPSATLLAGRRGPAILPVMIGPSTLEIARRDDDPDTALPISADERYAMGRDAFADGDHTKARALLLPLANEALNTIPFKEIVRILALSSANTHEDADTVKFFELLKQREPEYVIGFDTMIEVGRAYRRMSEHERARDVFLAINDASFLEESQVVGHLERADQDARALAAMATLVADHSDTDTVRSMLFALGQHGYFTGTAIADSPASRARRTLFLEAGRQALERHHLDYPEDAQADDVLLTLGNVLLELGRTEDARALSAAAVKARPEGRLVAAFDYMQAFAAFKRRDAEAAKALCARVIQRVGSTKSDPALTRLADQCRHMTAQILHARGEIEAAKEMYEQIKSRFPDAARALRHLERESLTLPAVTQVGSAEPLQIPIEFAGTGRSVEVRAYPVDLRLLYLKQRSFERLAELRLAGVTPAKVMTFALPDARGGVKRRAELTLPLEGTGAWLLSYRVGELHTRGMAIRSDLLLDVDDRIQDDVVRVHAAARETGAPAADVLVTLVGSASKDFVTRRSDLRGVCEAGGLEGQVAVIAERDGHYAFFQGAPRAGQSASQSRSQQEETEVNAEEEAEPAQQLLDKYRADNDSLWKSNTNFKQQGVEVQRAGK